MRQQRVAMPRVAFALTGTAVLMVAIGLACFVLYLAVPMPEALGLPFTAAFAVGVVTFAAFGAVIAAARPGNRIARSRSRWRRSAVTILGRPRPRTEPG